jgi:hypothetical protein
MDFLIADTFTDSLIKLTCDEQNCAQPAICGLHAGKESFAGDQCRSCIGVS